MSPRIIHIPLSGGDRKAQAKGIRHAHGIQTSAYRESGLIRSAAEPKIREADRLECEAWNAIMWAGGPAMPSPGDPQAEPTIGKAINGGYDLLEAKCNRCDRVSLVPLRALRQPAETPIWKLEAGSWKPRSIASRAATARPTVAGSAPIFSASPMPGPIQNRRKHNPKNEIRPRTPLCRAGAYPRRSGVDSCGCGSTHAVRRHALWASRAVPAHLQKKG